MSGLGLGLVTNLGQIRVSVSLGSYLGLGQNQS